jgi:hypothetical protein
LRPPPIPQRTDNTSLTPFTPFITCPCQLSAVNLYNGTLFDCTDSSDFGELLQIYKVTP